MSAEDPLPVNAVDIIAKAICCGKTGCLAEREGGTCGAETDECHYRDDALKAVSALRKAMRVPRP